MGCAETHEVKPALQINGLDCPCDIALPCATQNEISKNASPLGALVKGRLHPNRVRGCHITQHPRPSSPTCPTASCPMDLQEASNAGGVAASVWR